MSDTQSYTGMIGSMSQPDWTVVKKMYLIAQVKQFVNCQNNLVGKARLSTSLC